MIEVHTILGRYTPQGLEECLGAPSWSSDSVRASSDVCGLADGLVPTAGWGNAGACYRIWIHQDGICIMGGLEVAEDEEAAQIAHARLLALKGE